MEIDISSISQEIRFPQPPSPLFGFYVYIYMLLDRFEGRGGGGEPLLDETRNEEVLIKKVFHLTHKENIKKTKEVLRKPGKL